MDRVGLRVVTGGTAAEAIEASPDPVAFQEECLRAFEASQPTPTGAARLLPEEPLLLNKGAGTRTPMALPDGTAKVRFFASQAATITVDLRKQGVANPTLELQYASAQTVQIPAGVHAIVVHRVDNTDHAVSAVPST